VLGSIDWRALERILSEWVEHVLASLDPGREWEAVALDGKTLRGSKKQGAKDVHLLSASSHRLALTLTQVAVSDKTNEISAVHDLLVELVTRGYVFIVKQNQPTLYEDIAYMFGGPLRPGYVTEVVDRTNQGHGRVERRRLTTSTALNDHVNWPGVQQVFCLERIFIYKKTGEVTLTTVYGITSLTPDQASAEQLLALTRQHWHIENKSHWVRDVTFDEDRSQVRRGNLPHVLATLRNTVISILRATGATNTAKARRYYAARPDEAMALIGLPA
jgi:hypothetical protein